MNLRWQTLAAVVFSGFLAVSAAGCPKDDFDYRTWTAKLGDAQHNEEAVTALERLGDPRAIPALGRAWEKQGRPDRLLRVIVGLAQPLTPQDTAEGGMYQYTVYGCTKSPKCLGKERPAHWDDAKELLKTAITDVDKDNPRSVESAVFAAEALGKSKIPEALAILVEAANNAPAKALRGQAILSLGELGDKNAVPALANIIREDFNPKSPELHGAALLALGKIKSPEAVPVLIEAMYRLPFFFKQVRRALVASGSDKVSERMRAILDGTDADVNALFKEKHLDTYCGDVGKEPVAPSECLPVAAMDYYASIIAGDLYDPANVPSLIKVLGRDPKPAYYLDFAPGPPAQNAALDSIRKIGSPTAAQAVLDVWTNKDSSLRPIAANVFSYVSHDGSEMVGKDKAVDLLGKIAADNDADQNLRLEAATAFARLANRKDQIAVLRTLADKYQKASDDAQKQADGKPKSDYEAAKVPYDAAKAAYDAAKKKVRDAGGEQKAPVDLVNAETKAKEDFDKVKDPYTKAHAAWKTLTDTSDAYRGFERVFETHIARIEIALHCAGDAKCLAGSLKQTPEDVFKRVSEFINTDKYTEDDKKDLQVAEVERGLLDLGKMG
ncbi:MAG TPA: HEAT repeat domain-containing protein, partial [Kofleriaceae bacterium]|nr:HEAT repeat domain-containing protein [Kofleriaceae bacterium]